MRSARSRCTAADHRPAQGRRRQQRSGGRRDHRPDAAVASRRGPRGCRPQSRSCTRRPRRCWSWDQARRSRRACSGSASWRREGSGRGRSTCAAAAIRHSGTRISTRTTTAPEPRSSSWRPRSSDAGIRQVDGSIVGDGSYFDSKRGTPATGYRPSIELEGELDALSYDAGFQSSAESSLQPGRRCGPRQAFASVLKSIGRQGPEAHAGSPPG